MAHRIFSHQESSHRTGCGPDISRWRQAGRPALACFRFGAGLILFAAPLAAQGVSGAAIGGRVLGRDSTPLEQAIVRVTNSSNGERWQTATSARGWYFIEYLSVGGPYRIEVRAVGHEPMRRDSVFLALGQRLTAHFEPDTGSGPVTRDHGHRHGRPPVQHRAHRARPDHPGQHHRPAAGRRLRRLAIASPQVARSPNGGLSFTGQHDRLNSIQIDGTNNNDLFGRAGSDNGTPGWAVGLTAFTPEAVRELQVVTAPFDVRCRQLCRWADQCGDPVRARTGWKAPWWAISRAQGCPEPTRPGAGGRRGLQPQGIWPDLGRSDRSRSGGHLPQRLSTPAGVSPVYARADQRHDRRGGFRPAWESATRAWSAFKSCCGTTGWTREISRPGSLAHRPGTSSPRGDGTARSE